MENDKQWETGRRYGTYLMEWVAIEAVAHNASNRLAVEVALLHVRDDLVSAFSEEPLEVLLVRLVDFVSLPVGLRVVHDWHARSLPRPARAVDP